MLAIRLQRTGRSGHAQFRVIVQDSRFSPKSGRVVAFVGNYNPHSKEAKLDGEAISQYLDKGAQPTDRVAGLLKKEGIKLPSWVKVSQPQKRTTRNAEKLRRNRPAEAVPAAELTQETPADEEASVDTPAAEETLPETPEVAEDPTTETAEGIPEEVAEAPAEAEKPAEPEA